MYVLFPGAMVRLASQSILVALCLTVSASETVEAREVRLSLPSISAVPGGSIGPWLGVVEQWVDFYDVAVGQSRFFDSHGFLVPPTLADRAAFHNRLALESSPVANLPNRVVRVDFLWLSLQPNDAGHFNYERTDFAVDFALRRLGSQVIGMVSMPTPSWIEPFLYDAASGTSLMSYRQTSVISGDGITRIGEERLEAWERYVAATVARYRDTVQIWQILNEPDSFVFSPSAFEKSGLSSDLAKANAERFGELFDDFAFELIRRASRVIRTLDPGAKIAALGAFDVLNDEEIKQSTIFLKRLLQRGLADEVDIVSLHTFPRQWPGITQDPTTQTPETEALSLDRFTAPESVLEMASGTNLRFMMDEWGHVIHNPIEEQVMPQFVTRLIAQNLEHGVSPLVAFEAYDYYLFPRDAIQDVRDYYFLKTMYPQAPVSTPGLEALRHIVRLLAGAIGEEEINRVAPHATRRENPGYSYRSFTNGLDRIIVFWSNSPDTIDLEIDTNPRCEAKVRIVIFRWDGTIEVHDLPGRVTEVGLAENGIQPLGWFESAIVYFCPQPEASIGITGVDAPVVVGVPTKLEAHGPNGEWLAPSWRVVQGSGIGVISQDGVFEGVRGGICTVVADVGIHSASREIPVVDLSENLLANGGLDVMWSGPAGWVGPPWRAVPPAEKAIEHGASVGIAPDADTFMGNAVGRLAYPPTIGVGQDTYLTATWWPGYISQTLVSGLAALGTRPFNEPLLFFCWGRRTQGAWSQRYIYLHIALFDRFRDPQSEHKLADLRIGGRFSPGEDWGLVSSLEDLSAPYVAPGRQKTEFVGSDGLIRLPQDAEQLEVILEVDNRFESPPTTAEIDAVYLGPYRPLILVHPEVPSDTLELAWFFDRYVYPVARIGLYLDADLNPNNGNEWPIPGAQDLLPICGQPLRVNVAQIPKEIRDQQPIFAYGVATQGGIAVATDYAGPLLLKRGDLNHVETWSGY
jgi:hypothetical protein